MKNLNNETPAVGEVPPKPAGCVYGPWWDDSDGRWYCYCSHKNDFMLMRYRPDTESQKGGWLVWDARYRPECKQLLRVSAVNQSLRALVGELAEGLRSAALIVRILNPGDMELVKEWDALIAKAAKAKEAGL